MNSNIFHKYVRILLPLLVVVWGKVSFDQCRDSYLPLLLNYPFISLGLNKLSTFDAFNTILIDY